ncbi:MAG: hypothetical protein H7X70_04165, partial [Candidatus Kapabacteria bacterium]|nr:hypothetical protein [Candidatus Kapabacteria bacterium]
DRTGRLWFGTIGGVSRFNGSTFDDFAIPASGVKDTSVRFTQRLAWSIYEDKQGNIWFGMDGDGVRRYDGKSFTTYTDNNGLCHINVRSITQDKSGNMWLGTSGGVSRFDGRSFKTFTVQDGLASNSIWTVIVDQAGNVWFGTGGGGASRYDGNTFVSFKETEGLTKKHVQSIMEDKSGRMWFGCSGGLFRFNGKSFINVTKNGPWK